MFRPGRLAIWVITILLATFIVTSASRKTIRATTLAPPTDKKRRPKKPVAILGSALLLVALLSVTQLTVDTGSAAGNVFYVSKTGNNADGRSWATAWNELSQINWSAVQPGDTILVDGGQPQMVYTSTLTIGKSGTSSSPIRIQLATEAGRNGKAVVFGGRSTPLPYCGQSSYSYQTAGVREVGIIAGTNSWVVIDGAKWGGIAVYGHDGAGIKLSSGSSNIIVRNVEVYDNGTARQSSGWEPDQPGIALSGANNRVERSIVHDNGQDAFQSGGGVSNFALVDSWLYNDRRSPSGAIWNECTHSDGIQIYGGNEQSGLTIERSVVGPGFMQGVLLGQSAYTDGSGTTRWAVVHDVTVRNSLWYGSTNCNICDYANTPVKPRNWRIENVTSDRPTGDTWHNIQFNGDSSQIAITNSILYGGMNASVPSGGAYSGNYQYDLNGSVGTVANPKYANGSTHGSFSTSADYTLASDSPAAGKGSSITSASRLLNEAGAPMPSPTPTSPATPVATSTPSPTPTSTSPTPTPTPSATPIATSTPFPTPTSTSPTPTPTSSATPVATSTPSPTPTSTSPAPTPTPTPTATPSPATQTISLQVQTSDGDAAETIDRLVHWGWASTYPKPSLPYFAARFPGVGIPAGARIKSAKLYFWFTDGRGSLQAEVYGDASDNSSPITQTAANLSSRPATQNRISRDFQANPFANDQFGAFDVTGVINELVQRVGWSSGNPVTMIMRVLGGGEVALQDWNVDPAHAPKLEITYSK